MADNKMNVADADCRSAIEAALAVVDGPSRPALAKALEVLLEVGAGQEQQICELMLLNEKKDKEIARLKQKCNSQADYLEEMRHTVLNENAVAAPPSPGEMNSSADTSSGKAFLLCLVDCFCIFEEQGKAFRPQRQKGSEPLVYIPISDFYAFFDEWLPAYGKKEIANLLMQFGVVEKSEKGCQTSYNGSRMFKINANAFNFLTSELQR